MDIINRNKKIKCWEMVPVMHWVILRRLEDSRLGLRGRILKNSMAEIPLILNMPEKLFLNHSTIVFGLLYC